MTLQQVRQEYGSFRAAVEHYASIGCSRRMAAEYLGLHIAQFRRMVSRFGLSHLFPTDRRQMLPECRGVGHPSRAEANRRRAGVRISADELLPWVDYARTCREFQQTAPYSLSTVLSRFGSWREAKRAARERRYLAREEGRIERYVKPLREPFLGRPCRVLERDALSNLLWLHLPDGSVDVYGEVEVEAVKK